VKRLQIRTDMLLITSTGHGLFSFINIDDLEPLKEGVLVHFLAAAHTSRVNYDDMAGDIPRQSAYEIFSINHGLSTL